MIRFSIKRYEVFELTGQGQPTRLYMYDDQGCYRGYIDFIRDHAISQPFILHPNGIIHAFMPAEQLHFTLHVLRNEQPVYFSLNEAYQCVVAKLGKISADAVGDEAIRWIPIPGMIVA